MLEPLHDLVDDDLGRDLGPAQGDVEVLALAEAHLANDVGEQRGADDPLGGEALLAQVLLQQLAPGVFGVLARLGLEPLLDLVAGARRLHRREPVARGAALALGREDLHPVAGLQLVVQRHDLAVHARADAAVADLGVHLVGEVQRRGPRGERLDLTARGEHVHLVLEQAGAQRLHELARVRQLGLPVQHRAQPRELCVAAGPGP